MSYEELPMETREAIIKQCNENELINKPEWDAKRYSKRDVFLAIKLAYAACGNDTPVSIYNNILLIELDKLNDGDE